MPVFYKIPSVPSLIQPDVVSKSGYVKEMKEKAILRKTLAKSKSMVTHEISANDNFTSAISSLLKTEPPQISHDRIENLSKLYVKGDWKFKQEYECAEKSGIKGYDFVLDYAINEEGVGEPEDYEEIIEQNYNTNLNYL